jgi:hypothetical protein
MMKTFFLAFIPSISVYRISASDGDSEGDTDKDLVQYSVTGTASVSTTSTSRLGDRIQLIKEHDTWSSSSSLVKDVSYIGLGFTKPHSKELGTFDGNKVGLTLVCDTVLSAMAVVGNV